MGKRGDLQREKPAYLVQFGLRISGCPGVQSIGCKKKAKKPLFSANVKNNSLTSLPKFY
jgi:hypothetical protein